MFKGAHHLVFLSAIKIFLVAKFYIKSSNGKKDT